MKQYYKIKLWFVRKLKWEYKHSDWIKLYRKAGETYEITCPKGHTTTFDVGDYSLHCQCGREYESDLLKHLIN